MKKRLKDLLPKSEFAKNVVTLMTGSGIAQIISVLASILLARLYSPEDFGLLAFYLSIVTTVGTITALSYEVAIVLPKKDEEATKVFQIAIYSMLFMITLYILFFILFDSRIVDIIRTKTSFTYWRYLIVPSIFILVLYQILSFWANRKARYKYLSIARVSQSLATTILSILLGLLNIQSFGLILGNFLGQFTSLLYLILKIKRKDSLFFMNSYKELIPTAKKYIYFLKFATPSTLFNSLSNIGLPIIITIFYGAKIAGLYFFSVRVVRLPLDFMFSSFSQVYREKAAKLYNDEKDKLLNFTTKIQKRVLLITVPFLITISILAPYLFSIFFGDEWIESGKYIRYFSIFILLSGIYSPISSIADVLMEQKIVFLFNIVLSATQIVIFYICHNIMDFKKTLLLISVTTGCYYLLLDYYMKIRLKKEILAYEN